MYGKIKKLVMGIVFIVMCILAIVVVGAAMLQWAYLYLGLFN